MADAEAPTEPESAHSESGSDSESEEEQVEWLVTTREKRSTAGNRMNSLLQAEEPDDDLELLFAEADDDVGFSDVEDGSDVQMDSSSDEEDQGPAAGDDLEGEKELQKAAKIEARKKKKNPIPKIFKKKVRIDPTLPTQAPPRPKKKIERPFVSRDHASLRASARETTLTQRLELELDLSAREVKRMKQVEHMEKAAAAKKAKEKPPMTQEDRLKEAARVERANSKSLSRWEEAENQREEEQRLRLARLHDRTLEGPVLTFWSGKATYVDGKLKKVGKIEIEEKEKLGRKRKAAEMEESEAGSVAASTPAPEGESKLAEENSVEAKPADAEARPTPEPRPPGPLDMLPDGIPTHSKERLIQPLAPPPPSSSVLAPPAGFALFAPPHISFAQTLNGQAPMPGLGYNNYQPRLIPSSNNPYAYIPAPPPPPLPPPPPAVEHVLRQSVIYNNFEENAIKSKDIQIQILFGHKFEKLSKPKGGAKHNICAITGYPAKYRDPVTGLPYCNSYAYKEIQRLKRGDYKWSKLVGAYVGLGTYAARGVPERFIAPPK